MPGLPRPHDDETTLLLAFVAQQRDLVATAAHGLTDDQARATPTASALSVGGLVKHVAAMERSWMGTVLQRPQPSGAEDDAYGDGFVMDPDETLDDLLADLARAGAETEEVVRGLPLEHPVPVPDAPWFPSDVAAWSLRFVLLHLVEEVARHAGHADVIREQVDGATWYGLMAAREQLDLGPWVQPWTPDGDGAAA
ncbi:DinB family protein [Iamia sp. SCSIO 61187]|uniref:DinB family protein n=1 Tax=Iamia sp. SCSIO 61187 TaxID=2722752 RepID=UPI001C62DAC6|nr:DinB family protein [Iamia sp. SCSIO 61187]QYG91037.1 DinB family protein [Iamia sp. SCSIO 61187]